MGETNGTSLLDKAGCCSCSCKGCFSMSGGTRPVANDSESILMLEPIIPLLGIAGNYFKKKTGAGSARFCLWGGCCSDGWVPPLVFTACCQALLCPGALNWVWGETLNAAIPQQHSWL